MTGCEVVAWFTTSGWTTAHEIESANHSTSKWTACGREVRGPLIHAPPDMRHCGQCERRRP